MTGFSISLFVRPQPHFSQSITHIDFISLLLIFIIWYFRGFHFHMQPIKLPLASLLRPQYQWTYFITPEVTKEETLRMLLPKNFYRLAKPRLKCNMPHIPPEFSDTPSASPDANLLYKTASAYLLFWYFMSNYYYSIWCKRMALQAEETAFLRLDRRFLLLYITDHAFLSLPNVASTAYLKQILPLHYYIWLSQHTKWVDFTWDTSILATHITLQMDDGKISH